ncbi:helix-turn-helix transcriptional regulator [Natrinema sp. CGMCC1.2065]|uniref:helix-turn-helix transcriptional regulator n=1 Tax=Natrinema sp. CGMCC1.2065 TaxID=3445767 RepID=UPI003F4A498D
MTEDGRDDFEEAADEAFDLLDAGRPVDTAEDEIEAGIDQKTPTAGGDEVDGGTELEFDEDRDVDDADSRAACRFCQTEFQTVVAERRHHDEDRCDEGSPAFRPDGRPLIEPQVHELRTNFLFEPLEDDLHPNQDGLAPYFAVVSQWDQCLMDETGQDDVGTFDAVGDTWMLNHDENKISYRDEEAKIKTRPGDSGDSYNEYVIGVVAADDVGERKVTFQFRPSLPNAKHCETDERIQSMPEDLPLGIRVEAQSSNLEMNEVLEVLRTLMDELDIDTRYFKDECIHEHSRVWGLGLYTRIQRELSEERFVDTNGVMDRLAQFSSVRRGRGEYVWDNEEIIGHRHAVAMNETSLEKLYGNHTVGKLLKSYLPKQPEKHPSGASTYHPKIEVQFNTSHSDYLEGSAVPYESDDAFDYQDLKRELDEYLLFGLNAADLPLHADPDVYVSDAYWDAEETERDVPIHSDPTEELRETEEDLTRAQLAREELTPVDRAVVQALADGGQMHYEEIVDETETSSSSVYRAISKWGGLVEKVGRGTYDLADEVVRNKIEDVFAALEDVTEWVEDGIDAIVDGSDEIAEDSPIAKWARRHGAVLDEHYEEFDIELTGHYSKRELRHVLRSGLEAARNTGSSVAARFIDSSFTYRLDGERRPGQQPFTTSGGAVLILGTTMA